MKKPIHFQASSSLLGALLLISLLGTVALTSLDVMIDLYALCKSQWSRFTDSLTMMHPHRTVFPN